MILCDCRVGARAKGRSSHLRATSIVPPADDRRVFSALTPLLATAPHRPSRYAAAPRSTRKPLASVLCIGPRHRTDTRVPCQGTRNRRPVTHRRRDLNMRTHGIIRRWDAGKGFGFIQGAHSAQVFFHVRDFRGAAAPTEGMQVEYEEIHVGGKGPRAMDVRPRSGPNPSPSPHKPRTHSTHSARPSPRREVRQPAPATARRSAAHPTLAAPKGAALAQVLMLA